MNCKTLLCAESVIREVDTDNVSIINVLQQIVAESYPIFIPRIAAIAFFDRESLEEPSRYDLKFTIEINEKSLFGTSFNIDFQNKLSSRAILRIPGLALKESGKVEFIISTMESQKLCSYKLTLSLRTPITVEQTTE